MPVAEIITIGTELLLGEIQDTNTRFLASNLREIGVDLFRVTVVGDNCSRIAQAITESLSRCDILLITGGLGPTVDDPTRQAVANALNVELIFRPDLWKRIEQRFRRTGRKASENNRRQAYIPKGAEIISNPVGSAPAFIARKDGKALICLPGVPREMEYLYFESVLPYLREQYQLNDVIKIRVLHVASMGESQVDELIGELEKQGNPTVGLLASPGRVDVRITAKGDTPEKVDSMICRVETTVREQLGDAVYGVDDETMVDALQNALAVRQKTARLDIHGFISEMRIHLQNSSLIHFSSQPEALSASEMKLHWRFMNDHQYDFMILACLTQKSDHQVLEIYQKSRDTKNHLQRTYEGPQQMASQWAEYVCLDGLRRLIIKQRG